MFKYCLICFLFLMPLFSANAATCNWKKKGFTFIAGDTCVSSSASLYGMFTIASSGCYNYQWKINGTIVSYNYYFSKSITKNGSYNICLKITDSCNNCDTTICKSVTVTCINTCNWYNKGINFNLTDTCLANKGYFTASISGISGKCYKYKWYIDGNYYSNQKNIADSIYKNGYHTICTNIYDSCNNCDTTYCDSFYVSCVPTCPWYKRGISANVWDSCSSTAKINGKVNISTGSCYSYKWYINGNYITNTQNLSHTVYSNGFYTICLTIYDTCKYCDTTICFYDSITCYNSNCKWFTKGITVSVVDTCNSGKSKIYGSISGLFGSCYNYSWKVNSQKVSSSKSFYKNIFKNGNYHICLTIYDSCQNCDTSYCFYDSITCISSSCNWKSKNINLSIADSCLGTADLITASISNANSCCNISWYINGNYINKSSYLNQYVYTSGYYTICATIEDTCNWCDTSFCKTIFINCIDSPCFWKKKVSLNLIDSCYQSQAKIIGKLKNINLSGCYYFSWYVNGKYVGSNSELSYNPSGDGTYKICVKILDSCNNCDTTICKNIYVNCNSNQSCNWQNLKVTIWDSCYAKIGILNGKVSGLNSSCTYQYGWYINGNLANNTNYLYYSSVQNGTYTVCLKLKNNCNNCDTTICKTLTINCNSSANKCNWKKSNLGLFMGDSCAASKPVIVGFVYGLTGNCYKYTWKLNGNIIGNSYSISKKVTINGNYNLCCSISDTCNNCDTSICTNININCASSYNCNFKAKNISLKIADSCVGNKGKIVASVNTSSTSCLNYVWFINGNVISTNKNFSLTNLSNGNYSICVTIKDTCNKCDTSICSSFNINCTNSCNWKKSGISMFTGDSCFSNKPILIGTITGTKSCHKILWSVNNNIVSSVKWFQYKVSQNGNYTICASVIDTCNNCDTTYCISKKIDCVNAANNYNTIKNKIVIFPNPNSGIFTISGVNKIDKLIVYNAQGKLVYTKLNHNATEQINLSHLSNGIYTIDVSSNSQNIKNQIIIAK